jgi:P27 family predicted phage terminase small subunit
MPARNSPKPPDHLRQPTAEWWRSVCESYELEGHHERLLTLAAEAYDRGQQAREILDRDGLTVATADGGIKAHPCIGVERDARIAFARLTRELDLDAAPAPDTGPPALRSNRRGM